MAKKPTIKKEEPKIVTKSKSDLRQQWRAQIIKDKTTGKDATNIIMKTGADNSNKILYSSGIKTLDYMTGLGGLISGSSIFMYGKQGSYKSYLATLISHNIMKNGKIIEKYDNEPSCMWCDVENAFDPDWYKNSVGIIPEQYEIFNADSAESLLDIVESGCAAQFYPVVVIDSITPLLPNSEREGDMKDLQVAAQARLLSKFMRKFTPVQAVDPCLTLIALSQTRTDIGGYKGPSIPTGGKAMKYYNSLELELNGKSIKGDKFESIADSTSTIRMKKSKMSAIYREAQQLYFKDNYGLLRGTDTMTVGYGLGILSSKGAWISMNGENIFQGAASLATALETYYNNPGLLDNKILEKVKLIDDTVNAALYKMRKTKSNIYLIEECPEFDNIEVDIKIPEVKEDDDNGEQESNEISSIGEDSEDDNSDQEYE